MIDAMHERFRRWAGWVLEPSPGLSLGYGKNILVRIQEGKGSLLPGATSRTVVGRVDFVALDVEAWLKTIGRHDRYVLKVFYLSINLTAEEKAKKLKMPVRTLYDRVDRLHARYQQWLSLRELAEEKVL